LHHTEKQSLTLAASPSKRREFSGECKPRLRKIVHISERLEDLMDTALTTSIAPRVKELTSGDFEEIVRRHQRRVYRFLFMMMRDTDEADNLTQECFLRAFQNLGTFRGESSLETWLLKIAANLVRDHARSRKRSFWKRLLGMGEDEEQGAARIASPAPTPEQQLLAREEVEAVWRAANELSEQQRAVFLLRFVEEMELNEIGEVLSLRVGTVKSHLFRAMQAVRAQLRDVS
jgi:RNA polymerase sigma-70 factor, ECF subfamily